MELVASALREALFPALFGGEEVNDVLIHIFGHGVKHVGPGIPDHRKRAAQGYETS